MTTEKMTVHKALCELKTLDSRIQKCMQQKCLGSVTPCGIRGRR